MKVWLPYLRGGSGTDTFTSLLARALEERGHRAVASRYSRIWETVPFALSAVRAPAGADVVLANSWNAFAFRRRGIPLVAVEHHCVFDPAFRPHRSPQQAIFHEVLLRRFERASFRAATVVVGVSDYTSRSVAAAFPGTKPISILNGIDTAHFTPAKSQEARSGRPFRLLFVGNLIRRKGADLLPRIMSALGPDFELRFTSGLRDEARIEVLPNMRPLGRITPPELLEEYRQADVLLFPSRLEGFGYAVAEAMACGVPVVASNTSSLPELVDDGETGRLCVPEDPGSFVQAVRELAGDPQRRVSMGVAARARAVERFSLRRMASEYQGLLDSIRVATGADV